MGSNPYEFDPDIDNDIFESEDESNQESNKSRNISRTLDELLRTGDIEGLIDKITMKVKTPEYAKMGLTFLQFFGEADAINENSSFNRAIAKLVKNESDKELEVLWRIYDSERLILNYSTITRVLTHADEFMNKHGGNESDQYEEIRLLSAFMKDMVTTKLEKIKDNYTNLCAQYEHPVNEHIYATGDIDPNMEAWEKRLLTR